MRAHPSAGPRLKLCDTGPPSVTVACESQPGMSIRLFGKSYFVGVKEGVYEALWPVSIVEFDESDGQVMVAASDAIDGEISSVEAINVRQQRGDQGGHGNEGADLPNMIEIQPSYYTTEVRRRNHQAWFSSRVRSAYGYRCALSGLPLRRLLVGAHIVPDAEDGPASVTNGICMSTLHHTAFDTNLIGIDPDFHVHVSKRVRKNRDGPLLESLKQLHGAEIRLPVDEDAHPNQDYLSQRFHQFDRDS